MYAYVRNQFCVDDMIYKSNDNGATFVADTVGLPVIDVHAYNSCIGLYAGVQSVYQVGGKIYMYGGGFYSKYPGAP